MDPFVGEIRLFACNYAPQGWALCQGQLMAISQFTALFSLLGTYYGGDGRTTFALPNLTGRAMLAPGQGPGLSPYSVGQTVGSQAITLTLAQMGGHTHTLPAGGAASMGTPSSTATLSAPPGQGHSGGAAIYAPANVQSGAAVIMAPATAQPAGGSQPHNNMSPYLALNYCIAIQGVFPSRP